MRSQRFSCLALLGLFFSLQAVGVEGSPDLEEMKLEISPDFKMISEKKGPNFIVDLKKLQKGDVQQYVGLSEARDFDDVEVASLDRFQLQSVDSRAMFMVTKMAYLIPGKSPEYFTLELVKSPHFIRNTLVDTDAYISSSNTVRASRSIHVGPINIGKISFDFNVEELKEETQPDYLQRVLDFDRELGLPVKVFSYHMTNADRMLNGTFFINKYYRVNNQGTLIVSFQFSSIKKVPLPFFIIRNQTMKSAISESKLFVKSLREYSIPPQ
jgi:hypothetical protein